MAPQAGDIGWDTHHTHTPTHNEPPLSLEKKTNKTPTRRVFMTPPGDGGRLEDEVDPGLSFSAFRFVPSANVLFLFFPICCLFVAVFSSFLLLCCLSIFVLLL